MRHKLPKIFAHRGGRVWAPENTLAAFRKAVEAGCHGIELDVQRCASGELVVIHDADVSTTTDGAGLIADLTYDEIRHLSAGRKFSPRFKHERVPLLSEVLHLVDGKLTINIEVKNVPIDYPDIEDDLFALLDTYGHKDKIIISSFDHELIRCMHAMRPDFVYAFIVNGLVADIKDYAADLGARAWHPFFNTTRKDSVASAHRAGLKVNMWTLNQPAEWDKAIEMGVDGIVTDDPAGLKAHLLKLRRR